MKVLVTGAAGFIGSHIAEACCRLGASVIALDDLATGDLRNLAWKKNGDQLEFINGDIRDAKLLHDLLGGCDRVFHQAAIASVPQSVDQPYDTNDINLNAVLSLLVACRDSGVKRVVFASSSAIYGDAPDEGKSENMPPRPLSPYALQKYAAERYCVLFHQLFGLETVSLRYFNVFGPRQSSSSEYSGVIAKFCSSFIRGKVPVVYGDGLQSRDFIYIENVVQANLLAAQSPSAKVAGNVFNIGAGRSITLLDLIDELNRETGQDLKPEFKPARQGDVRSSSADISSAVQCLGYEPKVPWQEGLKRTLSFYRETTSV